MSFILTVLGQLVDVLIAIARDVPFKELFEEPFVFSLALFFLPTVLPQISWARAGARRYGHIPKYC